MRILVVHNYYQLSGGEDVVFKQEKELLRSHNHEVLEYTRSNEEINSYSFFKKISLGIKTLWAFDSVKDLKNIAKSFKPDVVHFHNTFPLISPAAYYVFRALHIPIILTLHNYRLLCPRADFFRDGKVCEDCLNKYFPWPGIMHACYHHSKIMSSDVSLMLAFHRLINTWNRCVNAFIVLSNFSRDKFIQAGLNEKKIFIKPNFVSPDPFSVNKLGECALFAGRLSPEKRVVTLLNAWKLIDHTPLQIFGSGSDTVTVERMIKEYELKNVILKSFIPREQLMREIKNSFFVVFPSEWYETFGLIIIEAFACGIPVIAAKIGAVKEIVKHGFTGLHFSPGDYNELAYWVTWAGDHRQEMEEMGRNARKEYEIKYSANVNYQMLINIYNVAREQINSKS